MTLADALWVHTASSKGWELERSCRINLGKMVKADKGSIDRFDCFWTPQADLERRSRRFAGRHYARRSTFAWRGPRQVVIKAHNDQDVGLYFQLQYSGELFCEKQQKQLGVITYIWQS